MSGAEVEQTMTADGSRFVVSCEQHALLRVVQSGQHAANLQALHNRVDHADDTDSTEVDLTAAAALVTALNATLRQHRGDPRRTGSTAAKKAQGRLGGALLVWEALTGLDGADALAYAAQLADATPPITAAVPPF